MKTIIARGITLPLYFLGKLLGLVLYAGFLVWASAEDAAIDIADWVKENI